MNPIDDIFQEYIRMREHGLEVPEALRALKIYVEPLALGLREQLAQQLRNWEKERLENPKPAFLHQIKHKARNISKPLTSEFVWLECHNCRKKNRAIEVFCYSCGELLQTLAGEYDTLHFMQASDDLYHTEYFGMDSVLILEAKNVKSCFEIRPQLKNRETIIGRKFDNNKIPVDIDLETANAAVFGVSRIHLGIIFDKDYETLQILDHSSSNGTYINEQKVLPSERRTIRHGDELRLGQLILGVKFLHPGEEL